MCVDIGELRSSNNNTTNKSAILVAFNEQSLVRNLIEMENKLPINGYFKPESAYVFTPLSSKAGKGLGLVGTLAQNLGSGYSLVLTGCLNPNGTEKQPLDQMVFCNLFFPQRGCSNWKINSKSEKVKLKAVLKNSSAGKAPQKFILKPSKHARVKWGYH